MKKFSLILLILLSTQVKVQAQDNIISDNFKYFARMSTIESKEVSQAHLNSDILQKSENGLNDLRIYDKDKTEIPYTILDNIRTKEETINYKVDVIKYSPQKNDDEIITKIKDNNGIRSITLNTANKNFRKKIKLSGSQDLKNWDFIASQEIYDFSDNISLKSTQIKFNKNNYLYYKINITKSESTNKDQITLKYKELNLKINENQDTKFKIDSIVASNSPENIEDNITYDKKYYNISAVKPSADKLLTETYMDSEDKKSIIKINPELPFDKLSFKINNNYYYRKMNIYYADKDEKESYQLLLSSYIYKIPLEKNEEQSQINFHSNKHKFYKIEIENLDNPPLELKEIKLEWIRKNLFFAQQNTNAEYNLYVGNKNIKKPSYDFSTLVNQENWFKQKYRSVSLTNVTENKDFKDSLSPEEKEKTQINILVTIIGIISLVLGLWIYRMIKQTPKKV
ncbi:MAG: DUF3999 family protein [Candidatus Sericytochromatia bacterium]|nr:DUF3999 family protein [Candidatus Sericytochromatia bacterium]